MERLQKRHEIPDGEYVMLHERPQPGHRVDLLVQLVADDLVAQRRHGLEQVLQASVVGRFGELSTHERLRT